MQAFNIGERVICVNADNPCHFLRIGDVYMVDYVRDDMIGFSGLARCWPQDQFVLLVPPDKKEQAYYRTINVQLEGEDNSRSSYQLLQCGQCGGWKFLMCLKSGMQKRLVECQDCKKCFLVD